MPPPPAPPKKVAFLYQCLPWMYHCLIGQAKGLSMAERMMKQMGWKGRGHGIGAYEQGISEPLIAMATGVAGQGSLINSQLNVPVY